MGIYLDLEERADHACELCGSKQNPKAYTVSPKSGEHLDEIISACETCISQMDGVDDIDPDHWRCLNDSVWSQVPAVQVTAYRMLSRLSETDWASDLQGMMYMDDNTMEWAQMNQGGSVVHKDSNGNILTAGDSVVLIQDLNVKGAGFTAKRGTAVRRISLVADNAEHIEGKINNQRIVILTKYVKKS